MVKNILSKIKLILIWLVFGAILCLVYFLSYEIAEPKAYDFMTERVLIQNLPFDNYKKIYGSDDIVLIIIDARSVEKYRWPWKRELYCDILNYLSEYSNPKVVVYDAIINTLDTDNPQSDAKFFNCIKKMDNYVSGFFLSPDNWENEKFGEKYDELFRNKYAANASGTMSPTADLFNSILIFPQPYFDVVKNVGSINCIHGAITGDLIFSDQIVRFHNPFHAYKGAYYPSLAMKTYMLLNKLSNVVMTDKEIIFPEISHKIRQTHNQYQNVVPIKFYKFYDEGYSHKNYSAIDVINSYELIKRGQKPIISPEIFKDKIVLIGANVPAGEGLNDVLKSAVYVRHPGVDIQATVLDNLIHNDFLNVISQFVNLLITIIGMLLVYFSVKFLNLSKAIFCVLGIIIGYLFGSAVCFYFNTVINIITPEVMFVLTTIFAYTHKYVLENKNKEKVQNAMGKYMSKDVMRRVVENIDNLGLGGKKAIVTVLFADIRGFTSISEKLPAQQVSEILNEYFSEMEPIITSYNGIINKFIGDAILAVFGEPIQDENHPENAVKCAYAMLQRVKELHKKWAKEGKPEIEIGVGINTGEVFVGNIGSSERMEYTVIGDTVNLASRLENYNKTYKTKMLISAATYKHVRNIADVIKIPEVQIRGKSNKIDIYEVLKVKLG